MCIDKVFLWKKQQQQGQGPYLPWTGPNLCHINQGKYSIKAATATVQGVLTKTYANVNTVKFIRAVKKIKTH